MVDNSVKNNILLVQSPPWGVYAPPLGIAYLAAYLKSRGLQARVCDLNLEIFRGSPPEMKERWDTQDFEFWASGEAVKKMQGQLNELADKIISYRAPIIGFSATFASAAFLNQFIPIVRSKSPEGLIIIAGGGGASYGQGRSLFKSGLIDYFVIGEGEHLLACLLKDIREGNPVESCRDYVSWKDHPEDKSVCLKAAGQSGVDINTIPFPTFEEFNLDYYTQKDLIPLVSSRGCIRSCVFCCDSPLKKPYRCRDPQRIAKEISYHVEHYGRRRFEFSDLLINGDLDYLDNLCGLLIKMDLNAAWGGQATVRKDMGAVLFNRMKQAGCGGLTFGVESCSDRVLKFMRKGVTSANIRDNLLKAKEAGMQVELNLIVGFPTETDEDVEETSDFIKRNACTIDKINSLNICTIGPGMYIYEHLEEYNIEKSKINDWYAWFTKDMLNTLEIRLKRHAKILSVCSELGLMPAWQNIKKP